MKEYFKKNENRIVWLVTVITMLIACSPLITRYCINGHDIDYHLLRIESLKEGIQIGKPFLKVNVLFFGEAGYASSMFYPDFLLYIPALLRVFGLSINTSYHVFVAICVILCYFSMYYCVRNMLNSKYAGILSAIIVTLCQYHMDDIYVRSAAGEYTAFIFLPLVFYGIYDLLYEDMKKPWLLGAGFGGVLLCHTASFAMCLLFAAAACILRIKAFKNKKTLLRLIATAAITAGLTAVYWLPMIEQLLDTVFYVSDPWIEPATEAVRFVEVFYNSFPSLGIFVVVFSLPRILLKKEAENSEASDRYSTKNLISFSDYLLIAGFLFALLATDILPWERFGKYLSFIQFPWRFFIMSSVLFSMADGIILYLCARKYSPKRFDIPLEGIVAVVVLIVCGVSAYGDMSANDQGYYDYSDDYYDYKPYTAHVIGGEWLPEAVMDPETLVLESERMIADDEVTVDFVREKNTIKADITAAYDHIDVPFIYYKGYEAYIENGTGKKELRVTGEGNNGFVRVYLTPQTTGKMTVLYAGTLAQIISKVITLLSVITLIVISISENRKKKEA
ncbi:MAG: YfhO family protein [Lachnospiraceae bacterium]|nr:YfhO family protein [Lachnospiraceae bacterium]